MAARRADRHAAAGPVISRFGSATVTRIATPLLLMAMPAHAARARIRPAPPGRLLLRCVERRDGRLDECAWGHRRATLRASGHVFLSWHVESRRARWRRPRGTASDGDVAVPARRSLTVALGAVGRADGRSLVLSSCRRRRRRSVGMTIALPNKATLGLGVLCFLCMTAEGAVLDWGALHLRTGLERRAGACRDRIRRLLRLDGGGPPSRRLAARSFRRGPARARQRAARGGRADRRARRSVATGRDRLVLPWSASVWRTSCRCSSAPPAHSRDRRRAPPSPRWRRSAIPVLWSVRPSSVIVADRDEPADRART